MNERLGTLIERLHEKTARREILWKKRDAGGFEAYETSFPRHTVELVAYPTKERKNIILKIYNEEGDMIEDVTDHELEQDSSPTLNVADKYWIMLRELHQMARRIALGTDEAIDELISVLAD